MNNHAAALRPPVAPPPLMFFVFPGLVEVVKAVFYRALARR